ncbi:PspC domain-containing protein [Actinoplanes sp. NEAU-A12]|uniref:PspC domain-containing protein n=1 Tax=Actinoplanes sandaracinus TaxID=3045177 RepID=A0ABT6X1Y8_9ACTN|nr:PspC domain-containing protein [Actinoplanes sandaracinus]MDI6106005.1 PspC domain-containing protein [Actinoplanes sandaracinus]
MACPPRHLLRASERKFIAGVASGIADHLGISVLAVRAGFVALTAFAQIGILLYFAFWMILPSSRPARTTICRNLHRILGGGFLVTIALLGGGVTTAVILTCAVLGTVTFLHHLHRQFQAERTTRLRQQRRAEASLVLHDQMLQTLTLIQRQAADPRAVQQLASIPTEDPRGVIPPSPQT